jgi:hypothetical protein
MEPRVVALLAIGALVLQGCTYVPGVEATDLSPVYDAAATRANIEAVLGEPVASRTTDDAIISVYRYNKGALGGAEAPLGPPFRGGSGAGLGTLIVAGLVMAPIAWATTPFLYADKRDEQKGFLGVAYAPDGPPAIGELWGRGEPEALLDEAVERLIGGSNEALPVAEVPQPLATAPTHAERPSAGKAPNPAAEDRCRHFVKGQDRSLRDRIACEN